MYAFGDIGKTTFWWSFDTVGSLSQVVADRLWTKSICKYRNVSSLIVNINSHVTYGRRNYYPNNSKYNVLNTFLLLISNGITIWLFK